MLHQPILADPHRAPGHLPLDLAVVIPTRNEAGNVLPLLARLDQALAALVWEAVFVDDNSPDGTAALLREVGLTNTRVRVIQRVGRRGLASAVVEGMLATAAPVLAVIDADGQHDEALLPALVGDVARGGHDLAVASRYMPGGGVGEWAAGRRLTSRLATRLAQAITGTPLTDPMSGFFVISRQALTAALPRLSAEGFKILLDLVASSPAGLKTVERPYVFRDRTRGESKFDLAVAAEYLALLLDKTVGRLVPTRLLLFLLVGGLGLGVHLGVLAGLMVSGAASFDLAQALAALAAMTSNFLFNNAFTYRDRRLRGWRALAGLLSFYAVCGVGAAANVGIAGTVAGSHSWWLAGAAGALIGAVWNFSASSVATWRR